MILYHTSNQAVANPDISHSRVYLDFGRGFYTTPNRAQAEKYAKRYFREGQSAVLNVYELDDDIDNYTHKVFEAYDGEWLDYVVSCRQDAQHDTFDVVEGGIADDDVFNTLDLYMAELISRDEAIKRLKKKKPNWQICLCNQEFINQHLHFVESIDLPNDTDENHAS